ncbi:MAG TPA: MBL fold metallo-hydrolase [Enhygromyxa sp.]|nr:MBL fold metallo-hydrolase [Enhygromyxa sp.]
MALAPRYEGLRRERVEASPRFANGSFHNTAGVGPQLQEGSAPVLREFLFGGNRRVPIAPLPSVDPRSSWARPVETGLRATWLGHSTVLIEQDGVRILTDPVWGLRASPSRLLGPRRFQPVPVAIDQLGPVDLVIVSHDHYDHLDAHSVRALARQGLRFCTSLGVGAHLEAFGVPAQQIVELDWWESHTFISADSRVEFSITAAPSQHFSGRGPFDRNRTLWSSFVITTERHRVFFSGDTGLTDEYREIATRLGPFDLVMLEVGAYHPAWGQIHLGPENALRALNLLGGGALLPIHWGTFNLALHDWDWPAEMLLEHAPAHRARLLMPRIGAAIEPVRVESVEPWWREISVREIELQPDQRQPQPRSSSGG